MSDSRWSPGAVQQERGAVHIGRRPFTSPVVSVVFYCALFLRVLGAVIGIEGKSLATYQVPRYTLHDTMDHNG